MLGGDHVIKWLYHFGRKYGLSRGDLERFDRLAKLNWLKAAIPLAAELATNAGDARPESMR